MNRPVRNTGDHFLSTKLRLADIYSNDNTRFNSIIDLVTTHSGIDRGHVESAFLTYVKSQGGSKIFPFSGLKSKLVISSIPSFLFSFSLKLSCTFLNKLFLQLSFLRVFMPPSLRVSIGLRVSLIILRASGIHCDPKTLRFMLSSVS